MALRHVAGIPPQHPLQLLADEPAPAPSARVLLRSLEDSGQALVQAGAALQIGDIAMPS